MARQPLHILITRPEPQAGRLAQELAARFKGVPVLVAPLMALEWLEPALPAGAFAALILTSETGARAAGRMKARGAPLPAHAFCVGDRTAEEARARGFSAVSAAGDARDLARLIAQTPGEGALLHLHGLDRAADMGALLPGRSVTSLAVYSQRAQPLPPEAARLLQGEGSVLVPLFSPRSARLLAAACPEGLRARLLPVAISVAAKEQLPPALRPATLVAARPDGPAMLAAIARAISAA